MSPRKFNINISHCLLTLLVSRMIHAMEEETKSRSDLRNNDYDPLRQVNEDRTTSKPFALSTTDSCVVEDCECPPVCTEQYCPDHECCPDCKVRSKIKDFVGTTLLIIFAILLVLAVFCALYPKLRKASTSISRASTPLYYCILVVTFCSKLKYHNISACAVCSSGQRLWKKKKKQVKCNFTVNRPFRVKLCLFHVFSSPCVSVQLIQVTVVSSLLFYAVERCSWKEVKNKRPTDASMDTKTVVT